MVDGQGTPEGEQFAAAIGALYGVAYTLKFTLKRAGVLDYPVLPLEALWDLPPEGVGDWCWTALIAVPDAISARDVRVAAATARGRGTPATDTVRLRTLSEGRCAQVMHVGPYDAEAPTIEVLHRFIADQAYAISGRHHEIYLSDPRRTSPDRLRTIIRYPVKRAPRGKRVG